MLGPELKPGQFIRGGISTDASMQSAREPIFIAFELVQVNVSLTEFARQI